MTIVSQNLIEMMMCGVVSIARLVSSSPPDGSNPTGMAFRDRLSCAFDLMIERIQEFTDSAYISHENRQRIVIIRERMRQQLNQLLRMISSMVSMNFFFLSLSLIIAQHEHFIHYEHDSRDPSCHEKSVFCYTENDIMKCSLTMDLNIMNC